MANSLIMFLGVLLTKPTTNHFAFLLSLSLTFGALSAAQAEVRKLTFPTTYPMGKLSCVVKNEEMTRVTSQATAIGSVSMNVPPGGRIELDVNPRCIENPEKLKAMPTVGIDNLKIGYMSMEEDTHICDKALGAVPAFKNALYLDCFRTDVTDAGIASFKGLPTVTHLMCFMSTLDGSLLKEYKRMQNVEHLNISHNSIKEENLKYLCELKKLNYLNLLESNISDVGMREICKVSSLEKLVVASNGKITDRGLQGLVNCPKIVRLGLAYDKQITDASIPFIQKLTQLKVLDISHTQITFAGLEKLKNLKQLAVVKVPETLKVSDTVQLQKDFPKTQFVRGGQVSEDIQIQMAPLK